jgi:hypothetical protein
MSALAVSADTRLAIRWPALLLVVAGLFVGAAIASGEPVMRSALNGVGGLLWLAGAAWIVWSLRDSARRLPAGVATAIAVVILVWFVRPVDLALSVVGFAIAGAVAAFIGRDRPLAWAMAVPATWLPVHLLMGAVRGFIFQHGQIRTVPPPTAAIVPLSMVLAAAVAGVIVAWLLARRGGAAEVRAEAAAR